MTSATIKLFLPRGDAKSLRTAEISNWTGKAIAAPRTELDELLQREELDKAGVYILSGSDPISGSPRAYIGEAEVIRERLKQHKTEEFWVSAIVFVSKDENLTKAHVRYLESRLFVEAARIKRFTLEPNQTAKTWRCFSPVSGNSCPSSASTFSRRSLYPPRTVSLAEFSSVVLKGP